MLLTRAFVPEDIQTIITGSDFALNIYEYIPLRKLDMTPKFVYNFELNLTPTMFDTVGIKYKSTVANCYSVMLFLAFIIVLHIFIYLLKLLLPKCIDGENMNWFTKFISWVSEKCFNILTFGYYIRNAFEISQYVLISSIYEIYEFNPDEILRIISFIIAIIMILLYISILLLVNYLIFSFYDQNESNHNKLGEFFLVYRAIENPDSLLQCCY